MLSSSLPSTTPSISRTRARIEAIVARHATKEAKAQLESEKAWRRQHERSNERDQRKERRPVTEQTPVLLRLETEGLEQLWEAVKENKSLVHFNTYCRRNNSPCWIWQATTGGKKGSGAASPFTTKQGYGYIALLGLGKTSLMVTHLALWTRSRSLRPSRRFHVSHLCHRPACFNPDHLCQEHREHNAVRNGCRAFRDEDCLVSDCIHHPPCIVAHVENEHRVKDKSTKASSSPASRKRKHPEPDENQPPSDCIDLTSE